ncbi:hypothetical protein Mpt1_c04820 [Candidatus Methanoplasma termitum]|uniref:Zinc-ribbon domain-containing protein n=1 Tax=Candidatus Methanoplasma termitum TaxID=1577791 RepID=A0A0A7LBC6_9ARCH|nr:hypothetical protein [Candidatus Methanoplasma termitum]AIZ56374.1 hypothetical protein Mpt1_c04820 [Candidatus Methanoplasma termitum]MCL2333196.1 hypothetical protein [Candidatus Methanoplasma sp.]
MENGNFPTSCKNCGSTISGSDRHCRYCGAPVTVTENTSQNISYNNIKFNSGRLRSLGIWSLLWAVFAIAVGLFLLSVFKQDGSSFTDMIRTTGILAVLSGIFSMFTAILAFIRRGFIAAFACCIISSVLALPLILGVIGLVVAYRLYKYRDDFVDH